MAAKHSVKPSREEKKAQTRASLIDAAGRVFARHGFAVASLDDVAEEAGLTKGAVYSNFKNKDDLITELIAERLDNTNHALANFVDRHASADEQAAQAGELFMRHLDANRDTYLLAMEFNI